MAGALCQASDQWVDKGTCNICYLSCVERQHKLNAIKHGIHKSVGGITCMALTFCGHYLYLQGIRRGLNKFRPRHCRAGRFLLFGGTRWGWLPSATPGPGISCLSGINLLLSGQSLCCRRHAIVELPTRIHYHLQRPKGHALSAIHYGTPASKFRIFSEIDGFRNLITGP
jgi:hypothetical protein